MPRAASPSTPSEEIEARRRWDGPVIAGVLTQELAEFCQSGVSIVIAASTADGLPIAGVARACRITPGGRMRILLSARANMALLGALARGSAFAATFSAPRNHRSIQIKALSARQVDPTVGELDEVERQVRTFTSELVFVSYTPRFAGAYTGYSLDDIVAIEFSPHEAFVQTPGPGAGEHLVP